MKIISADEVHAALKYPDFVDSLQDAYAKEFTMPPRKVFLLDDDDSNHDAFALLPSWIPRVSKIDHPRTRPKLACEARRLRPVAKQLHQLLLLPLIQFRCGTRSLASLQRGLTTPVVRLVDPELDGTRRTAKHLRDC